MKRENLLLVIGTAFSVLMGLVTAFKTSLGAGWSDEFYFVECALNYVSIGDYVSYNWPLSGGNFYTLLLVPWLKIFGLSRMAAAGFNVFWASLTCIFILYAAIREKLFTGIGSVILFCLFYWCGADFAWSMTCGRGDMMVMFFTVTSAYLLFRKTESEKRNLLWLGLSLFALTVTWISSLAVVVALGLFMLITPASGLTKKTIIIRGIVSAFAIVCALVISFAYQYFHGHLIQALYTTFLSHSATVTGELEGSATGLLGSYLPDWPAILALLSGVIVCLVATTRRDTNWWIVCFIAAIPAIMVGAGHYAYYYHWLFYVPVAVFAAHAFTKISWRGVRLVVLVVSALYFGNYHISWFVRSIHLASKQEQEQFQNFLNQCAANMKKGDHVVVTDAKFFYPCIASGFRPWVRYSDHTDLCFNTMPEKVDKALNRFIKNENRRAQAKALIERIEKLDIKKMPTSGYLFTHDASSRDAFVNVMAQLGGTTSLVSQDGEYRLFRIEEHPNDEKRSSN